jgi:long-chain acyl-CoA synthetase
MQPTLNAMFRASVREYPDQPALSQRGATHFEPLTYEQLWQRVRQCASGLRALGVQHGDRVTVVCENRVEWVVTDFAIMALGAISVPLFPTLPAPQIRNILDDCGSRWLVVSDAGQLSKATALRHDDPRLQVVAMVDTVAGDGLYTWDQMMHEGARHMIPAGEYDDMLSRPRPEDLASIVYTSGTSGDPKGVMLTHHNFVSNVEACQDALRFPVGGVLLSVLPLNHCLERTAGLYLPLACGAHVCYAQSLRRLRQNLTEVRPTYMILVPRILEAFQDAVLDSVAKLPALRRRLAEWAIAVGERRLQRLQERQPLPWGLGLLWRIAGRLVLSRLREAAGFDRVVCLVSGGAALPRGTATFYHSIGVPVLEGYGLTEATPVVSFNRIGKFRLGTVGQALTGVSVRVGAQSEVLVRGGNVMSGYYGKPGDTAEAIDQEGWLHTGDVGAIDPDGFISITDRIKDIIVLSNGKNVSPQPVENLLRSSPYIAQAVLIGDGYPTVTALLVPAFSRVRDWLARTHDAVEPDDAALARSPLVRELIRGEIRRLSASLADFESLHGFALLGRELSAEEGELTPTLKVKRRVVVERYAGLIAGLYGRGEAE